MYQSHWFKIICVLNILLCVSSAVQAVEPILPEMVTIPAGEFIFGISQANEKTSIPRRWDIAEKYIYCPTFSISIYETSTREFRKFILDGGYRRPEFWSAGGNKFREFYAGQIRERYPAGDEPCAGVSYYEAEAYCRWLSVKTRTKYRLPTEIEWEKAARGTEGRLFPWGNRWIPKACNWNDDSNEDLIPNGEVDGYRFIAEKGVYPEGISPYGCFEMSGNVCEWCASWIDKGNKKWRVLRGGHFWMIYPRFFQTTYRSGAPPEVGMVFMQFQGC